MQGAYLLTVTVFDQATEESSSIVKNGVEIMRLLPGLEADGTIQFASDSGSSTGVDITEDIGEIQIEAETGYTDTGIYMLLKSDAEISADDITIYVNGENIADTIIESSLQVIEDVVRVEITGLAEGDNVITFIVSSGNRIGAVSATIEWSEPPSHFLFTDNGDGTCTITGENPDNPLPSRENLTIPEEVRGLMVTAIGASAFEDSDFTGKLTIPSNVTTIGEDAFASNSFTGTLTLPEGLQTIGRSALDHNSFTGSLVIPSSVATIGANAFRSNSFAIFYCEADSKPSGWASTWNFDYVPVIWGYKGN